MNLRGLRDDVAVMAGLARRECVLCGGLLRCLHMTELDSAWKSEQEMPARVAPAGV